MNSTTQARPESNESLWRLIMSPTIWAAHFLLCYITAAVYCAKFAGPQDNLLLVRGLIAGYTLVAVIGIGWDGAQAARRLRLMGGAPPFGDDTPEDRHRFLGFATLLLAGLSLVATLFSAMVAVFFEDCR